MSTRQYSVLRWMNNRRNTVGLEVVEEEPLSIRVQGVPYTVVMRMPGNDLSLVAGFCLTEGLVDAPEDMVNLASCDGTDTNVITVTLTPERQRLVTGHLDRRGYISQTSCGLCGKTLIGELMQALDPLDDMTAIRLTDARAQLLNIVEWQPMRRLGAASHAAIILDASLTPLVAAEDVGRHNALDKAIGRLFLDRRLNEAKVVVLSSRISYELVQKTARARIPIVLALSRPTGLAVDLASRLNISLAGMSKSSGMFLYCHPQRFLD